MTRITGPYGANTSLSNLFSTAINTSLISDTDSTDDLGSSAKYWANGYVDKLYLNATASLGDGGAGIITVTGVLTATSAALTTPVLGTPTSGTLTNCTGLPAASVVAGSLVAAMEASDHGTAATDQIINVSYGTGAAPTASTTTEGSLYITYTA